MFNTSHLAGTARLTLQDDVIDCTYSTVARTLFSISSGFPQPFTVTSLKATFADIASISEQAPKPSSPLLPVDLDCVALAHNDATIAVSVQA